ncbi:baculoviral IAP repeat-containing protein 5-like [Diprion similis]|uniref:baculoviral IAP repeat-containing protein 5-like n=1 Tax=Diprion similis TaxID=362088 RepID=UPI001EF8EF10|nr:baculoviral IAP repeat-containing protein 5-like [Diprion similis]
MEILHSLQGIHPQFWKKNRLESFENWPFQSNCVCTPERMAAAGFVLIGGRNDPDLVECFVCSKQLDEWDSEDDPWNEHLKHMPSCPYIKIGKQDELDWTVPELFTLIKEFSKKSLTRKHEAAISEIKQEVAELSKVIPKRKRSRKPSNRSTNLN